MNPILIIWIVLTAFVLVFIVFPLIWVSGTISRFEERHEQKLKEEEYYAEAEYDACED